MKGLLVALAFAGLSATAYGGLAVSDNRAHTTAGHVKRLERHNQFGMRDRMGGQFKLSATYCERRPNTHVVCKWDALAVLTTDGETGFGPRNACSVEVRIWATKSHHSRWRHVFTACAVQRVDAPS